MARYVRLAGLYFVLLAVFTAGRVGQGAAGVPYERGHQVFSIVILTALACLFYGAFCRRWLGFRVQQAVGLALLLGLTSQVVIFAATVASYAVGADTYFTHPAALNVPAPLAAGEAAVRRLYGLLGNTIMSGIIGALGWALGGLLPAEGAAAE